MPDQITAPIEPVVNANQVPPIVESDPKPDPKLDHVLKDMHRFKEQARVAEEKLKNLELQKMKDNQEWQKIAEVKETEARQAREEAESVKGSYIGEKKFSAVKEECLKLGIRAEALPDLDLIDFSDVAIETTSTGRINVIGAKQAADKLKILRPHWFGSHQAPAINSQTPGVVTGGPITMKDVFEAEAKYKKSQSPEDLAVYKKTLEKFRANAPL